MLTLPSLSSSSAEARLMSLLSGMCLICFMALMSSLTLMTVSLQGQPACGTAGPRPPPGLPRAGLSLRRPRPSGTERKHHVVRGRV